MANQINTTEQVEKLQIIFKDKFTILNKLMQDLQILLTNSREPNNKTPYTATEKNNIISLNNNIEDLKLDLKDILKEIEELLKSLEDKDGDKKEGDIMVQDKEEADRKAKFEEEEELEKEKLLEIMKILNMLKNNVLDISEALSMISRIGQHFVAKVKMDIPMNSYTQQSFQEMKNVLNETEKKTGNTFGFNQYQPKMKLIGETVEKKKKIKNNKSNIFAPKPEIS